MCVDFDVKDNRRGTFHWRKAYYGLVFLRNATVWSLIFFMMDLFLTKHSILLQKTLHLAYFFPDSDTFSLAEALLWIMDCILAWNNVTWWTGVVWYCGLLLCFYQLFGFSFWRHPFTAEHPLLSKCNCISANLIKKQTQLYLGWPEGDYIFSKFSFLGDCSFKWIIHPNITIM